MPCPPTLPAQTAFAAAVAAALLAGAGDDGGDSGGDGAAGCRAVGGEAAGGLAALLLGSAASKVGSLYRYWSIDLTQVKSSQVYSRRYDRLSTV